MRIGTSYFVSEAHAVRYFLRQYARPYSYVRRAICDGRIKLGAPPVPADCTVEVIDDGCRYALVVKAA